MQRMHHSAALYQTAHNAANVVLLSNNDTNPSASGHPYDLPSKLSGRSRATNICVIIVAQIVNALEP